MLSLELGWDPNVVNANGVSPLAVAVYFGCSEMVEILLEKGADPINTFLMGGDMKQEEPMLHIAASKGYADIVEHLIKHGAPVDDARGIYGRTPLHVAAAEGQVQIAELLLSKGADIEARTISARDTPLHKAAFCNQAGVVSLFLSHGVDKRVRNADGNTAYEVAFSQNAHDVMDLLQFR